MPMKKALKVGRPKLEEKKNCPVQLNFTEREYALLLRESAMKGHTVPKVVRDIINKVFYYERPQADLSNTMLIYFRNSYKRITRQEAKDLFKELAEKLLYEKEI